MASGEKTETLADQNSTTSREMNSRLSGIRMEWIVLLANALSCTALALTVALAVNGYQAIDTSSSRYESGQFKLRVSDVTTLVSSYIARLLSGAVNWNPSSTASANRIQVNDTNPAADFSLWYYYMKQQSSRRAYIRIAAGIASLAWANSAAVSENGTSISGNGCRHVVNSGGLAVNSTLSNSIVPCIKTNSISWAMSANEVSEAVLNITEDSNSLSLVDDELSTYYEPGAAVLFDPSLPWNSSQATQEPPTSTLFSGTKSLSLLLARPGSGGTPCTSAGLGQTSFDSNHITQYLLSWNSNCYLVGTINFTAGVTNSSIATYISSRVVEDQTPLSDVVFEPSPWVNKSLWLMPDLMTMIAVMNSTLLPTWDNVDCYVELLIRQSYLAAWDTYHAWFDMAEPLFDATLNEPRVKVSVSFSRVFSWLAICSLSTLAGLVLLLLAAGYKEEDDGLKEMKSETWVGFKNSGMEIIDQVKPVMEDVGNDTISVL